MARNLFMAFGVAALAASAWYGVLDCKAVALDSSVPFFESPSPDDWHSTRLVHLLLHCLNAALVFIALRRLSPSRLFEPTAAAAFFAVHPAMAGVVAGAPSATAALSVAMLLVGLAIVVPRLGRGGAEGLCRTMAVAGAVVFFLCSARAFFMSSVHASSAPGEAVFSALYVLRMPWTAAAWYEGDFGFRSWLVLAVLLGFAVSALFVSPVSWLSRAALWTLAALIPFVALEPCDVDAYLAPAVIGVSLFLAGMLGEWESKGSWGLAALVVALGIFGVHSDLDRWKSDEALWRHAVEQVPDAWGPRLRLARALESEAVDEEGEAGVRGYLEALQFLRDARERMGEAAESPVRSIARTTDLKIATMLVRLGRFSEGLEVFESLDATSSASPVPDADVTHASALVAVGRLKDAEARIKSGLSAHPESIDLLNLEATVTVIAARNQLAAASTDEEKKAARNACEEGIALYEAILDEHPQHLKTRCDHAKAVIGADWLPDHPIRTTKLVNDLVEDFPHEGYVQYLRARVLAEADAGEAIRLLDRALVLDPTREEGYELLSHLLIGQGRTKDAKAVLDKGLESLPGSPRLEARLAELMIALGKHHLGNGAPDLAERAYAKAADLAPHVSEPWLVTGEMHLERAQQPDVEAEVRDRCWEKAREAFERALEIEEESVRGRSGLAQYFRARGYGVLLSLSSATRGLEGKERARRKRELRRQVMLDFRRALALAPEDERAEGMRSLVDNFVLDTQRAVEEALELVPDAGTLSLARDLELVAPRDPSSHLLVGLVLRSLGQFDRALDAFDVAIDLDDSHLRAHWESGRMLFEEKRWGDAAARLTRFRQLVAAEKDDDKLAEFDAGAADMIEQCRRRL